MPKIQKKMAKAMVSKKSEVKKAIEFGSKQAKMIALMKSQDGATLLELIKLTGWMGHSVRGTISATFKKRMGLVITRVHEPRGNVYRIKGGK